MSAIELSHDDPRLGRYGAADAEGNRQVDWPALDIDGNEYDRRGGIVGTRAVGTDRFVVLSISFKGEIVLKGAAAEIKAPFKVKSGTTDHADS